MDLGYTLVYTLARMTLGQAIQAFRKRLHLSQNELARRSAVPQGTISRVEADQQVPTLHTLSALASALETTVDTIMGSVTEAPPFSDLKDVGRPDAELAELNSLWPVMPAWVRRALVAMARSWREDQEHIQELEAGGKRAEGITEEKPDYRARG